MARKIYHTLDALLADLNKRDNDRIEKALGKVRSRGQVERVHREEIQTGGKYPNLWPSIASHAANGGYYRGQRVQLARKSTGKYVDPRMRDRYT